MSFTGPDGKHYKAAEQLQAGDSIVVRENFKEVALKVTDMTIGKMGRNQRVSVVVGDSTRTFAPNTPVEVSA